ncbi:hypothetical protein [Pseudoramibacter alactolyticus]|uniref:hypothetical protein n=1 Tax=Pseudoramibacter alactolyticus TaxID=113287 RepID=UPI00248F2122|nr:hypothetical protein [Pseudoramibacter alactolyticus]
MEKKKKRGCLGTLFLIIILIIGGCSILDSCGADKTTTTKKKTATPEYKRIANTLRNEYDFGDGNETTTSEDMDKVYSNKTSKYAYVIHTEKASKKITGAEFYTYQSDMNYLLRCAELYSKKNSEEIKNWIKANPPKQQMVSTTIGGVEYSIGELSQNSYYLYATNK